MKKLFLSYEQKVLFEMQHDLCMYVSLIRGIGILPTLTFCDILGDNLRLINPQQSKIVS